jgi:PAS domain S-box-containing protein
LFLSSGRAFRSEPILSLPPSKGSADSALPPEATEALLAAARAAGAGSPIAIIDESGRAVEVTAFGLTLAGAADRADFERRLLTGEGPGARRLRRLAATLPVAGPLRLERIRRLDRSRADSHNVRCVRVAAPFGVVYLVLAADDAGVTRPAPFPAAAAETQDLTTAPESVPPEAPRRSRFLWSLDKDGRLGAPDPALVAALGAFAPKAGETLGTACFRAIENGDALVAAVRRRETFSGVTVLWRADGGARAVPVTWSGAPLLGAAREFVGFRGFGKIGDAVEAAAPVPLAPPPAADTGVPGHEQAIVEDVAPAEPATGPAGEHIHAGPPAAEPGGAEALSSSPPLRPAPQDPLASQERSAAIYILRQSQPASAAPSKIVPIRPGAFEASRPQETGDGSVELSKAERDAFREIARALVGRMPGSRVDAPPGASEPPAPSPEPTRASSADADSERPAAADPASSALRNALQLLDRLPVGVLVARDAQPLYVNLTLLALLGYRDLEHFESSGGLASMFPGDDRPSLSDADGAFSIVAAEGRVLAVEGRAQAIAWDGGPATLIMLLRTASPSAHSDDRRFLEGEAKAGAAAAELREMLALATDGAVVLDSAGRIQSFNAPAERLFGYRESEVAGESVLMLLAPPSHLAATARLDGISRLNDGAPPDQPLAVIGRDRDGAQLMLALTLAGIGAPEAPQYCALFRDIRRERETERRLTVTRDAALAASEAKTEFLSHASHEIRTPLHAILGFAEVMMEERFGPIGNDRYRDYLKDIHASGKHVMSLADDLLDLSKIESGKLDLAFAPVDANSLIRECVSLMQPQAARERIIMRVSLFDRLPRVMVDERSLRQIMLNLMSNAVKFNEPGGQVIVSTAVDAAGQAVIRVRDTGVGMNESEVGVALEPFGQVRRGGRKGGVGLGLPLTKALVEANKAEFSIKSRRDHGTLVEICFPIVQAAQ